MLQDKLHKPFPLLVPSVFRVPLMVPGAPETDRSMINSHIINGTAYTFRKSMAKMYVYGILSGSHHQVASHFDNFFVLHL